MQNFVVAIDIAAPAARVWDVMRDVERWPEWTPSVSRVRRLGKGPLAVGSRAIVWQPKFPPAMWTVTHMQEGREFTWVSRAPGLRVIGRHGVDDHAGGARATLTLKVGGLFGALWARLTRNITERYLRFEAEGLKARSEQADPGAREETAQ
jgi:uncharacterized membrane protein